MNAKTLIATDPNTAQQILRKIIINNKIKISVKNLLVIGWEGRDDIEYSERKRQYEIAFYRFDSWGIRVMFPYLNHKKDLPLAEKELARLRKIAKQQADLIDEYYYKLKIK